MPISHQFQTLFIRKDHPGNQSQDGSGHGFCCLFDPNALLCHLSMRQRPLLLAQFSAKCPTHTIWNVLLALPKPLPTQLLFTHTRIFLNRSVIFDSACQPYLVTAFSHPLRTSERVLRLVLFFPHKAWTQASALSEPQGTWKIIQEGTDLKSAYINCMKLYSFNKTKINK